MQKRNDNSLVHLPNNRKRVGDGYKRNERGDRKREEKKKSHVGIRKRAPIFKRSRGNQERGAGRCVMPFEYKRRRRQGGKNRCTERERGANRRVIRFAHPVATIVNQKVEAKTFCCTKPYLVLSLSLSLSTFLSIYKGEDGGGDKSTSRRNEHTRALLRRRPADFRNHSRRRR